MRLIMLSLCLLILSCGSAPKKSSTAPKPTPAQVSSYQIISTNPHDPSAFTQGLVFHNGTFYESTGQYGESTIRKVDVGTGKVLKSVSVPETFFAEGMTILKDKVYQITWREQRAFVYDLNLKAIKEMAYKGEGWGLTNDGTNLILSDGTHVIRYLNPETFETEKTITVLDDRGKPLMYLNELEFVRGEIWANIWHSEQSINKPNHIARIDPNSGKLLGWINLTGISPDDVARDPENTLNGIAYDAATDRIWVTGKQWRNLFEIKLK